MGIQPKDWMNDKDGRLSCTNSKIIPDEAKANCQVMSHVLRNAGFVNYPTEY